MKVSIQECLRQYFIQEHGIAQADAALLILDPEFGAAIEPYFLEAVGEMVEFELPRIKVPTQEVVAKMHDFCDIWCEKYDDQRRFQIQEYLTKINHPMDSARSEYRTLIDETPTHLKFFSFALWGGIILLTLWWIN